MRCLAWYLETGLAQPDFGILFNLLKLVYSSQLSVDDSSFSSSTQTEVYSEKAKDN